MTEAELAQLGEVIAAAVAKAIEKREKSAPAVELEGDLWYKDLGNGETELYQFHNGNWILISSLS